MKKTLIKICGIKQRKDSVAAFSTGASHVGFVIEYPNSTRSVAAKTVAKIVADGPQKQYVGVFVGRSLKELVKIVNQSGISIIQLHGKENTKYVWQLKKMTQLPVWKYVELKTESDLQKIKKYIGVADKVLVDRGKGSGNEIDPKLLQKAFKMKINGIAGGINEKNVREYITKYHPEIIDVSSGVEKRKGIKSVELIKRFMNEVKKTYA